MRNILDYIFNPFKKINAKGLMLFGIVSSVVGALISNSTKTIYSSIFSVHSFPFVTYANAIAANFINIIIPCILLFILSKSINRETKMIDILNISFLYRIPFYILPFVSNTPIIRGLEQRINQSVDLSSLNFDTNEWIYMIGVSLITVAIILYALTLLINGFRNASNAKTWLQWLGFATVIFISSVVSKLLIGYLI